VEFDVSLTASIQALSDQVKSLQRKLEEVYSAVPLYNTIILSQSSASSGSTIINIPSPPRGVLREVRRISISTLSPVASVTALFLVNGIVVDGAVGATPILAGYSRGELIVKATDTCEISVTGVTAGVGINVAVMHWDVSDRITRTVFP
jgi:hypothetical protein